MKDPQIRTALGRHLAASAKGNQDAEHATYHYDAVEYPQSSDRIRGPAQLASPLQPAPGQT